MGAVWDPSLNSSRTTYQWGEPMVETSFLEIKARNWTKGTVCISDMPTRPLNLRAMKTKSMDAKVKTLRYRSSLIVCVSLFSRASRQQRTVSLFRLTSCTIAVFLWENGFHSARISASRIVTKALESISEIDINVIEFGLSKWWNCWAQWVGSDSVFNPNESSKRLSFYSTCVTHLASIRRTKVWRGGRRVMEKRSRLGLEESSQANIVVTVPRTDLQGTRGMETSFLAE